MKRLTVAIAIAVMLVIALPHGPALGQQLPPGPSGVYQTKIEVASLPGPFEVIQAVLDFAPGAWTPPHTHGAHTLNTVLDGEITLRQEGTERTFKPGEMWSDHPGVVHAAGNTGTATARLLVVFVLPKGAPLTTAQSGGGTQQLPPGPTAVYQNKIEVASLPAPFEVIQAVLDFAPGAWTPPHTHGGPTLNTILAGEIALRHLGHERSLKPGEMWSDQPDQVHAAGNATAATSRLLVVFLLPKGTRLTTVQGTAPVAMPRTGGGTSDPQVLAVGLLMSGGIGLIAARWWGRRRHRRRA